MARDPFMKLYGDAIRMWTARFDTAEIAEHIGVPEYLVARWVVSYREIMREARCA